MKMKATEKAFGNYPSNRTINTSDAVLAACF
jgi:hypothetical protein